MSAVSRSLADLPRSDIRRERLTGLECSAGLLDEVRDNLDLAGRKDLATKITPILRAVKAGIRRRRARGLLPDVEEGFARVGEQVYPIRHCPECGGTGRSRR